MTTEPLEDHSPHICSRRFLRYCATSLITLIALTPMSFVSQGALNGRCEFGRRGPLIAVPIADGELIDKFIDELHDDIQVPQSYSLVSKRWVYRSQHHIFSISKLVRAGRTCYRASIPNLSRTRSSILRAQKSKEKNCMFSTLAQGAPRTSRKRRRPVLDNDRFGILRGSREGRSGRRVTVRNTRYKQLCAGRR